MRVTLPVAINYVADETGNLTGPADGATLITNGTKTGAVHVSQIGVTAGLVEEVRVLPGLPGVGRACAARVACEIGDISRLKDANHLASYGGVAPARHESGTSARKRKRRKGGNRRPENALMQSARAASKCDPRAKAHCERKLAQHADGEGMQLPGATRRALRALARRRVTVIFAMLRDGSPCEPSHQSSAA